MSGPESGRGDAAVGPEEDERQRRRAWLAHLRHEFRTPLNAILGYSEILLEEAEGEPDSALPRQELERIRQCGLELLGLVNECLDPARLEADASGPDAAALGERVRAVLRKPSEELLEHVEALLRLPQGGGEELRKIRSAAERLAALVREMSAESRPEHAAPAPSLPAPGEPEAAGWPPEAPPRSPADRVPARSPRSTPQKPIPADSGLAVVLVADDNEANRDVLARWLERQGHVAVTVENGRRALELLASRRFDLVLLDLMMPEMNGYQALQRIKTDPALRHIPVIMISALDEMDTVVRCIEIGAEDYLSKPFNAVLLQARIDACLEKKRLRDREVLYLQQIEEEKQRAEDLLHVILPAEVVRELKATNAVTPRRYDDVAVLFCDIVDFTSYCEREPPEVVIRHLQALVERFEEIVGRYGMQKIKTIGDAFMATAGLLDRVADPLLTAVQCGLEMLETVRRFEASWDVRIGLHAGPVMAGVVGRRQFLFDLWGDTVNTAARVESHGAIGSVNVSGSAWERIRHACEGESLGVFLVKGKGPMEIFRVDRLRKAFGRQAAR